jgi:O-antigen/teichoic acid export membrane protein
LLRNVGLFALARLLPAAINFLAITLYSRFVSRSEYGRYALVMATASLATSLCFTWLRMGLLRFLPGFEHRRAAFLSTLRHGFLLAIGFTGLIAAMWWSLTADATVRALLPIGLAVLWANAAFELNLDLTVSELRPALYGRLAFARAIVAVGVGSLLAWRGYGAMGLLTGVIIGLILPLILSAPRQWAGATLRGWDAEALGMVVRYSAPLVATLSLEYIVNTSDRFFLEWLRGPEAVGTYAVGYDLAQQTLTVLLVTINLGAYPTSIRALEREGEAGARRHIAQQGELLLLVGFPGALALALLSGNIAHVLLGSQFRGPAAAIIPLIALATLIGGMKSYYFDLSFQFAKVTTQQIWLMLAAALTNVVCNLLWIPRYGASGAAWATIGAYAVGLALSAWRGRHAFVLPLPWRSWGRISASSLFMAAALWPVRSYTGLWALFGQVAMGIGAFGVALLALDVLGARTIAGGWWHRVRAAA